LLPLASRPFVFSQLPDVLRTLEAAQQACRNGGKWGRRVGGAVDSREEHAVHLKNLSSDKENALH
jgi:hypothetical protein